VALILLVSLAVGGFGMLAYGTYDYVQHDNDFCTSCHLMAEPFELFQVSAHKDLSCKACHHPTTYQRARMGLEQILYGPEQIGAHAEVENEKCAACHVEGDPEQWALVGNTAGHKVHLDSEDRTLRGLQCVECHSVSIHEFAPTDRTCGQSGCHDEIRVALSRMEGLGIHCVTCHQFNAELRDPESELWSSPPEGDFGAHDGAAALALNTLRPGHDACLACHEMREIVGIFPEDEPHGGECSTCHNPHDQVRSRDAGQSCAEIGCHTMVDTLPVKHHVWADVDVDNCSQCHEQHDFRVEEDDCLRCHSEILREPRVGLSPSVEALPPDPLGEPGVWGDAETARLLPGGAALSGAAGVFPVILVAPIMASLQAAAGLQPLPGASAGAQQVDPSVPPPDGSGAFNHNAHRRVNCLRCHQSGGAPPATDAAWCNACHHAGRSADSCESCHVTSEMPEPERLVIFGLPGGADVRSVSFPHTTHMEAGCAQCHEVERAMNADEVDCVSCHVEHHESETECAACHNTPPSWAHEEDLVHATCTGSVCHTTFPAAEPWWTRSVCLACHEELRDEPFDPRPPAPDTVP
jgi:hypothetical protein